MSPSHSETVSYKIFWVKQPLSNKNLIMGKTKRAQLYQIFWVR